MYSPWHTPRPLFAIILVWTVDRGTSHVTSVDNTVIITVNDTYRTELTPRVHHECVQCFYSFHVRDEDLTNLD